MSTLRLSFPVASCMLAAADAHAAADVWVPGWLLRDQLLCLLTQCMPIFVHVLLPQMRPPLLRCQAGCGLLLGGIFCRVSCVLTRICADKDLC
jgi:hypothetical protein